MRTTAALTGAIVLLTACSGGDIVVKNNVGERYVVKDSAVTNFESNIDRHIKYYRAMINLHQNQLDKLRREYQECAYRRLYEWCYDRTRESIVEAQIDIGESKRHKKLVEESAASESPLVKQFLYRPIFIDLNNNKKVMSYITLTCMSPEPDAKKAANLFDAIREDQIATTDDLSNPDYKVALKVCQKYAYEDTQYIAYRESYQKEIE